MRVLVVDDSSFMRRALATMLNSDPDIEVVGVAANGREGVELAQKLKPDVITLDIEMPEMDGLTALRQIMRSAPTQVLMVSSLTTEGSEASLKALKLGAADVLAKEHSTFSLNVVRKLQDSLLDRVKALGTNSKRRFSVAAKPVATGIAKPVSSGQVRTTGIDLICIGSSTGGPPVLEAILEKVPGKISQTIVIAQHMPEVFTRSMAQRLNNLLEPEVIHIEGGMSLQVGKIYIAPGGIHTKIHHKLGAMTIELTPDPKTDLYKPSVSALFESVSKMSIASRTLGVVLTGIGDDGLRGAKALQHAGGRIWAQDEASCVVYGMPKAVTNAKVVEASLAPASMADLLAQACGGKMAA